MAQELYQFQDFICPTFSKLSTNLSSQYQTNQKSYPSSQQNDFTNTLPSNYNQLPNQESFSAFNQQYNQLPYNNLPLQTSYNVPPIKQAIYQEQIAFNDIYKPNLVESKLLTTDSMYNSAYFSSENPSLVTSQFAFPYKNEFQEQIPPPSTKNRKLPFQFKVDPIEQQLLQKEKQSLQDNDRIREALQVFHQLDDEHDSEDEGIEDYKIGGYHPVHVGEVLQNRYVTIQKLGWGHFSTVWLSKDFRYNTYVAIKIQKSAEHYLEAAYDEVEILQKVAQHVNDPKWNGDSKSRDDCHVVQLLNSFIHKGPYGNHFCMVFEILSVNLLEVIKRFEYKGIPLNICKKISKQILIGLDYLHRVCGVIHTDLKPENVLLQLTKEEINDIIENGQLTKNQIFKERLDFYHKLFNIETSVPTVEQKQTITPKDEIQIKNENWMQKENQNVKLTKTQKKNLKKRQQKKKKKNCDPKLETTSTDTCQSVEKKQIEPNQNVEQKRKDLFLMNSDKISFKKKDKLDPNFQIKIADLGNGCWTHHHFSILIQTRQYRSPEVLIGMKYNATADMWSFACMLFELFTGDFLFEPRKGHHFSKNDDHLAQMQELIGKFPLDFSLRGLKSKRYFDKKGNLLRIPILNIWSLKNVLIEKYRLKVEEAEEFASFIEPMLNPYPEKRMTATEALKHSWLNINENDNYTGKMSDEEYRDWQLNKQKKIELGEYHPFQQKREDGDEDADRSESPVKIPALNEWKRDRFMKQFGEMRMKRIAPRVVERKFIDRSFTDLGYIGFGDGIETELLDSTANWQFANQ